MLIPSHPQKFHSVRGVICSPHTSVYDIDMIYANYPSICVGVIAIDFIIHQNHNITAWCGWIDGVLFVMNIEGCVVDYQNVVVIKMIMFEKKFVKVQFW